MPIQNTGIASLPLLYQGTLPLVAEADEAPPAVSLS